MKKVRKKEEFKSTYLCLERGLGYTSFNSLPS